MFELPRLELTEEKSNLKNNEYIVFHHSIKGLNKTKPKLNNSNISQKKFRIKNHTNKNGRKKMIKESKRSRRMRSRRMRSRRTKGFWIF